MFLSCIESDYKNKKQSTWVVDEINYESKTTIIYKAISTDTTYLREVNTWFADTIGAFKVGDTLIMIKKTIKEQ